MYFAHQVLTKLIRIYYDINSDAHAAEDMMTFHPDIAAARIKRIAVTRQPETRILVVTEDGHVLMFLHDVRRR